MPIGKLVTRGGLAASGTLVLVGLVTVFTLVSGAPVRAQTESPSAYGVLVDIAGTQVGPTPSAQGNEDEAIDSLQIGSIGSAGALHAIAQSDPVSNTTLAQANVASVDLDLDGFVTIDAGAVSNTCFYDGTQVTPTVSIATLTVVVDGVPVDIPANPAPNTTIPLLDSAGNPVGTLVLNERIPRDDGGMTVNAIHFTFTSDPPGEGEIVVASTTCGPAVSPTPSPTASPTPSPSPSPTASPTPSPTASPTPSPTPTQSPTPSPTASPTPSPTASPTPSPSPTASPTPSPSASPTPSPTTSSTPTPTESPVPTPTPSPTDTSPAPSPSGTPPPPDLPTTGSGVMAWILWGAFLLAGGSLLVLLARRAAAA